MKNERAIIVVQHVSNVIGGWYRVGLALSSDDWGYFDATLIDDNDKNKS
jgi:hypothetical protein